MGKCENCTHFNQSDNYPYHIGWCGIELPAWVYQKIGRVSKYDTDTTVRVDDSCSFWSEK